MKKVDSFGKILRNYYEVSKASGSSLTGHERTNKLLPSDSAPQQSPAEKAPLDQLYGKKSLVQENSFGKLEAMGPKLWRSSSGLLYGEGSEDGNRIRHVISHTESRDSKPRHSRFLCVRRQILKLLDEAWAMRGKFPPIPHGNKSAYFIPMGRVIGTRNETWIKIIVKAGNYLITAFPIQPGKEILRRFVNGMSLL